MQNKAMLKCLTFVEPTYTLKDLLGFLSPFSFPFVQHCDTNFLIDSVDHAVQLQDYLHFEYCDYYMFCANSSSHIKIKILLSQRTKKNTVESVLPSLWKMHNCAVYVSLHLLVLITGKGSVIHVKGLTPPIYLYVRWRNSSHLHCFI